jgi:hypothetical protein
MKSLPAPNPKLTQKRMQKPKVGAIIMEVSPTMCVNLTSRGTSKRPTKIAIRAHNNNSSRIATKIHANLCKAITLAIITNIMITINKDPTAMATKTVLADILRTTINISREMSINNSHSSKTDTKATTISNGTSPMTTSRDRLSMVEVAEKWITNSMIMMVNTIG